MDNGLMIDSMSQWRLNNAKDSTGRFSNGVSEQNEKSHRRRKRQQQQPHPHGQFPFIGVGHGDDDEEEESKVANDPCDVVLHAPGQPKGMLAHVHPGYQEPLLQNTSSSSSLNASSVSGKKQGKNSAMEEKKRKRKLAVAAASRANRLKKKKEFEELRDTNKKLLKERTVLMQMINDLKTELKNKRHSDDPQLLEENIKLQQSVTAYRGAVKRLRSLLNSVPE